MKRLLIGSLALISLAAAPTLVEARYLRGIAWYPGFTGTGQVAPTGGAGGGGGTAGCASTGGYQGYGDCTPSGVTVQRYYSLRAFSYASAQAGQYLAQVCGDGASGSAATTVCQYLKAKSDGTPDFANAISTLSGNVVSLVPGTGTVTTNACFKADGACRVFYLYDGTTQTSTAGTGGATATIGTVANRPVLYQNCQNNTTVTTIPSGETRACLQFSGTQSLQDTALANAATIPFHLGALASRASGSTSALGIMGIGTVTRFYTNSAAANNWIASNGTAVSYAVTDGAPASVDIVFNSGAASLVNVNSSLLSSTTNFGTAQAGTTLFLGQSSGAATLTGVGYEWAYDTGSGWTGTTLGYASSNRSSYYTLGF